MAGPPSTYDSKQPAPSAPQQPGGDFTTLVNQIKDQIQNDPDQADATAFGIPSQLTGVQVRTGIDFNNGEWSYANGAPVDQVSLLDAMRNLTIMSPDELQKLQRQMYDAGLYPDSYYNKGGPPIHYGQLDDATISAYKTAALDAYRTNGQMTIKDVIDKNAAAGYGKQAAQSGTAPPPLVIQLTNGDNIKASADTVARKVVGRKLTPQELQWFVDSFHSMEATAQQQDYQMKYGNIGIDTATGTPKGPGGTYQAPPSLDANYLQYMLRQQDPNEANAQDTHQALSVAASMLGGKL